jgi:hypothetical protein
VGGEAATRMPVKHLTAGSSPAPRARRPRRSDGNRSSNAVDGGSNPSGRTSSLHGPVDQWLGRHPLKVENRDRYPAGSHARGVGTQPPLRTEAFEVRLLARARHRWRQRAVASHMRDSVRAALTAGIRASSNGRAAVLQTADGGSIPSARTLQSEASGEAARLSTG